jgi:hypothetical protein
VLVLGVIGDGECDATTAAVAEEVGREIARRGAVLVCGGLGGVMAAACRGARSAGGMTVGILPGPDRAAANSWVDIPVVTGLGEARNVLVVRTSQAIIAVGGQYGTLSEIAFALKLGVPVVGLDTWQLARRRRVLDLIVEARTPAEAVDKAFALIHS